MPPGPGSTCAVLIPDGYIALGKLAQALVHGARVVQVRGNFDRALALVRELAEKEPVTVVNSINPYRIEGQKTGAFEVVDVLGDAPDVHCIPVGNAGNITAYWKGYREYQDAGKFKRLPRMLGFQAAGAAPIVLGHPVEKPETIATAIRIGKPASWYGATAAASESGGLIDAVTDEAILEAYRFLAQEESVFCEPASAASVAGLLKVGAPAGSRVVCVLTGHGLKDPDVAIGQIAVPKAVDAELAAVRDELAPVAARGVPGANAAGLVLWVLPGSALPRAGPHPERVLPGASPVAKAARLGGDGPGSGNLSSLTSGARPDEPLFKHSHHHRGSQ